MARALGGLAGRWQWLAALDLARHGFPGRGEGGGGAKSAWGGALNGSAPAPHSHIPGCALVCMAESTLYCQARPWRNEDKT